MYDLGAVEASHHMDDSVALAYVLQELVAQAFALGCAADKARDVDELDGGGSVFLGTVVIGQPVQTAVRDCDRADVWLDGAERVVGRLRAGIRYGIEKGALTNVGEPDYAQFHICLTSRIKYYSDRLILSCIDYRLYIFGVRIVTNPTVYTGLLLSTIMIMCAGH